MKLKATNWKIMAMVALFFSTLHTLAQNFELNPQGYFSCGGVDVMAFSDFYPEGHQGGVSIIMNGQRIATNGDIRMEATPGQWQPVPRQLKRETGTNSITTTLCYPDSSRHLTGFNPMIYPDYEVTYTVNVVSQGRSIVVTVDLDKPVPSYLEGKVGFNMELFPGALFGKPWMMDSQTGIYPRQPNSPLMTTESNIHHTGDYYAGKGLKADFDRLTAKGYSPIVADDVIAEPYAVGKVFTSQPDDPYRRITVESQTEPLKLYDGRMNHNNGWFVLRSEVKAGATRGAVRWIITPNVAADWHYTPVVQTSQVGYYPTQPKKVVIELDARDQTQQQVQLMRIAHDGEQLVASLTAKEWGRFLRYRYLTADFSHITQEGLYIIRYGKAASSVFRIAGNVYDRGVWQPVVEYFLPVQMCHMRVSEKYRVWHDACHMDDAQIAVPGGHFDGYAQESSALGPWPKVVEGVNIGGWHDAGDFDLRVESQAGEAYILALTYEAFRPDIDVTAIDQDHHCVEIHESDGKNDVLQQVENGVLTVVSAYRVLGRPYRGIICNSLRQYAMLGDAAAMTDGKPGNDDDRWLFTEDNPQRTLATAAHLAAAARVLRGYNDALSNECLAIAREIYDNNTTVNMRLQAAVELYLSTGDKQYLDFVMDHQDLYVKNIRYTGWFTSRLVKQLEGQKDKRARRFAESFRKALTEYQKELQSLSAETPYGVPYRPSIWGAGWDIQRFGFEYYYLTSNYPDIFAPTTVFSALDFILGCHPGSNNASFASGVDARSATVAYGLNRADWTYIPGGVVSGTALIRPDFPELLEFPFLWQQTEYVLGGGSSHYIFLVLAAQKLCASGAK